MPSRLELLDALQATSILLVFITLHFTVQYSSVRRAVEAELPMGERDREKHKNYLVRTLVTSVLPPTVFAGTVVFLLTPLSVRILRHSRFTLSDFDLLPTMYILITLATTGTFVGSTALCVSLYKRILLCKAPPPFTQARK